MNERIKQLAIEARLLTGWPVGEVEYQKFAELIIHECMRIDIENRDAAPAIEIANYFGMTDSYQKLLQSNTTSV